MWCATRIKRARSCISDAELRFILLSDRNSPPTLSSPRSSAGRVCDLVLLSDLGLYVKLLAAVAQGSGISDCSASPSPVSRSCYKSRRWDESKIQPDESIPSKDQSKVPPFFSRPLPLVVSRFRFEDDLPASLHFRCPPELSCAFVVYPWLAFASLQLGPRPRPRSCWPRAACTAICQLALRMALVQGMRPSIFRPGHFVDDATYHHPVSYGIIVCSSNRLWRTGEGTIWRGDSATIKCLVRSVLPSPVAPVRMSESFVQEPFEVPVPIFTSSALTLPVIEPRPNFRSRIRIHFGKRPLDDLGFDRMKRIRRLVLLARFQVLPDRYLFVLWCDHRLRSVSQCLRPRHTSLLTSSVLKSASTPSRFSRSSLSRPVALIKRARGLDFGACCTVDWSLLGMITMLAKTGNTFDVGLGSAVGGYCFEVLGPSMNRV